MHQCVKFILFWNDTLHVSDGFSVHRQEFKTVNTATKQILLSACQLASKQTTRCTNLSNLFYFGMTLYMFRTVFPSIVRSSRLYIQQPNRYCCLLASKLASRQQYLFGCCMYSLQLLTMDGKTVRNMQSVIPK